MTLKCCPSLAAALLDLYNACRSSSSVPASWRMGVIRLIPKSYMDTNIQKAFVNGIPGCAEHQLKLATALQDACKKHRSLTICFVDLANAYGSVHHNFIHFSLQHYHAPNKLITTVASIYTNLSAEITTTSWSTPEITLRIGVYKGDPSPQSSSILSCVPLLRPSAPTAI